MNLYDLVNHRLDIRSKWNTVDSHLRRMEWTDKRVAEIPDEESAALAFSLSSALQLEFRKDLAKFLAYWRSLRMTRKETR